MSASPRVFSRVLGLACWLVAVPHLLWSAENSGATALPYVARNVSEYWNPPPDGRQKPQPIDMDAVVLFYDPEWKLLWAGCSDGPSWFDNSGQPLPMRSGQRVRIAGTFVPAVGIDGSHVQVTVLADEAWPRPVTVSSPVAEADRYDGKWVSAEGYVCRQIEHDASHLQLDLLIDDRDVILYLTLGSTDPVPQLAGRRVRVNYVYAARRDAARHVERVEGYVPAPRFVTLLRRIEDDQVFRSAATPIELLGSRPTTEPVRVVGEVRQLDPGRSLTVRDATGQIVIQTEQPLDFRVGDMVEVIGTPLGSGLDVTLRQVICRRRLAPSAEAAAAPDTTHSVKLRLAAQIAELSPEEVASHVPATLRGVITWSDPHVDFSFLQDQSGGVRVRAHPRSPPSGSTVVVDGTTSQEATGSVVWASRREVFGASALTQPAKVTLEDLLTGSQEAQRVSLEGYVRGTEAKGPWTDLHLTTATGELTARIASSLPIEVARGARVRVDGVCATGGFDEPPPAPTRLLIADPGDITVLESAPTEFFKAPRRSVSDLLRTPVSRAISGPVRLRGVVTLCSPGKYLYLQEGGASILVLDRDTEAITVGDGVEVVGLPGREGARVVLRDALARKLNVRAQVAPAVLDTPAIDPSIDGRLVTITGTVQESVRADRSRWLIRNAAGRFEAWADRSLPVDAAEGSVIAATGIYRIEYDDYRQPRAFTVQLRDAHDVRVIRGAPWLTGRRALIIVSCFAACVLLGFAWVVGLRRRVRAQTEQIRRQLETETRLNAELERATRLESLGVLAGGIAHDFNNLLTVITANIGLAAMDERVREAAGDLLNEAERGARRAADITQQLLTFARGGDPVRTAVALPDVVREAAQFASHGSRVRCVFENDSELPPADVDRAQIGRVVHNLVLNAIQAMPQGGTVRIELRRATIRKDDAAPLKPGPYVQLIVADDGLGIPQEHLARIFEPYFSTKQKNNGLGLATVHSIVKKHQGHITVKSAEGEGTRFDVWLPAAEKPALLPIAPTSTVVSGALHTLFMDDEEVIRKTAEKALAQLGHTSVTVPDGMAAVRAYQNALTQGRRFDVVVLDLTVPGGVGGRAAMEMLRRIDPSVRAIVSSGYSSDPVLANFRQYGFSGIVAKPYTIEDLARTLNETVHSAGVRTSEPVAAV